MSQTASEHPDSPIAEASKWQDENSELLIDVQSVTKTYRIWANPQARLQHPLLNAVGAMFPFSKVGIRNPKHKAKALYRDFHALSEVSMQACRGDAIGFIGRNGAGKSTLLQIICGTLMPTYGTVRTKGRVAALLELGSGFNPDFSGRENVWMNGAILGMPKAEIQERMPHIEEFADLGDFIEQPVKTYSSGMQMRLAFAVATCSNPDVLVVDEALSVGDIFFSQKCMRRIKELRAKGTTLLFVSHDANLVQNLCEKALFLKNGECRYFGDSKTTARLYFQESGFKWHSRPPELATIEELEAFIDKRWLEQAIWLGREETSRIAGIVRILGVRIVPGKGKFPTSCGMRDDYELEMAFVAERDLTFNPSLTLTNRFGQIVTTASPYNMKHEVVKTEAGQTYVVRFSLTVALEPGDYTMKVAISTDCQEGQRVVESEDMGPLKVVWDYDNKKPPFVGLFDLPYEIAVEHWKGGHMPDEQTEPVWSEKTPHERTEEEEV